MNDEEKVLCFYVGTNKYKYQVYNKKQSKAEDVYDRIMIAIALYSEHNCDFKLSDAIKIIYALDVCPTQIGIKDEDVYADLASDYFVDDKPINDFISAVYEVEQEIKNKRNDSVCNFFSKTSKLKNIPRTGHIYWDVQCPKIETIAEHVFGVISLAIAINSEYNLDLDFDRVLEMLSIHELEEIIMGDLTEFDIANKNKLELGKLCTDEVLNGMKKKDYFQALLDEFNDKKTKEAQFAFYCDKLEYLLQVKIYEENGYYDFDNRPSNVVTNNSKVVKIINDGADTVFKVHVEHSREKFDDDEIFLRLLDTIKSKDLLELSTKDISKKYFNSKKTD